MTNSIELRREDWEKLNIYHEEINRLLIDAQDFLYMLLQTGIDPDLEGQALKLRLKMETIAKFLFVEDPPFGISALGDA
jgi:hypothetical protein